MEAALCNDREVVVIGGGNSANQAALFLSESARHVHLIVRGPALSHTMSQYLVSRITCSARITLHPNSEIVGLEVDASLKSATWMDRSKNRTTTIETSTIFAMIGAEPNTAWLPGSLALDEKGFVFTGYSNSSDFTTSNHLSRTP